MSKILSLFTDTLPIAGNAAFGGTAPDTTASELVGNIIFAIFNILGVIFFVLMVYAGVLWMTANGDPKRVTKAKDILTQATIGLVITLSAYAVSYFVAGELVKATTGT